MTNTKNKTSSSDADVTGRVHDGVGAIATRSRTNTRLRRFALGVAGIATPLAIGSAVATLARSRRAGNIAGGITAAAVVALRWQLVRWFTAEPAFSVERTVGELEIRRYAPRVEAHTRIKTLDFETSLDEGYRRLAHYINGANERGESVAMTTPVMTTPRGETHTIAFVMPPGRTRASLPRPRDERVAVVDVPARRVAALRFSGRYTGEHVLGHVRRLHDLLATSALEPIGQPLFAGFDPPSTLPPLRRAEVWVEIA